MIDDAKLGEAKFRSDVECVIRFIYCNCSYLFEQCNWGVAGSLMSIIFDMDKIQGKIDCNGSFKHET